MKPTILVVDDELRLAEVLSVALEARGFRARAIASAPKVLEILKERTIDLVLTDLRMPEMTGRELLLAIMEKYPDVPVIVMTAYASVRDAVALVKEGAFDYISKPFEIDDIVATISRALRLGEVIEENRRLREELEQKYSFDDLVGESPAFRDVLRQVTEVCASKATVLLEGESGTGKELIARAIHYNSPRRARPFIAINCAAIPETLLESELFGHAKGAFTGATGAREGRFVAADGGTLMLDEIGDMPLPMQAKVLRAIQEQTFEPVGSDAPINVDVRIIAATHKDLRQAIEDGKFREDLYYRLNIFPITLPPLRERAEDVTLLATRFLRVFAQDMGKPLIGFSSAAEAAMRAYSWPGNIRELQNGVQRAVIVAQGKNVDIGDLPRYVTDRSSKGAQSAGLPADLDSEMAHVERDFILKALEQADGVQKRAAELLGVSERSLWHRIKKFSIRIDHKAK